MKDKLLPGEEVHKKQHIILLRLAGLDQRSIAASVGVSQPTVSRWLNAPDVQEDYLELQERITDGALHLLQARTLEVAEGLMKVFRSAVASPEDEAVPLVRDSKTAIEVGRELLDRAGVSKTAKTETHTVSETRTTFSDDPMVQRLRELPIPEQEHAAQLIEELEILLNSAADG
jgi:hypothetical protein